MDVHILPALEDNYMYLLVDKKSGEAAVVDPVQPSTVLEKVKELGAGVKLTTVLTTHHHWDHAGGNKELAAAFKGDDKLRILGGEDRVEAVTQIVTTGDQITFGGVTVDCYHTPCHTRGHICYKVTNSTDEADISLFTGDTLFIAGAGKFFEGNGEQMYNNLVKIIGSFPDHTKVYCGHEYTLSNLKFAKHVEPQNEAIDRLMETAVKCKAEGRPTVPSTVATEKAVNPFMRVTEATVQAHAGVTGGDPVATMAAIRNEKNAFRG